MSSEGAFMRVRVRFNSLRDDILTIDSLNIRQSTFIDVVVDDDITDHDHDDDESVPQTAYPWSWHTTPNRSATDWGKSEDDE